MWCVQIMRWFLFQPQTVTALGIGSVAMINTLFYPARPTCLSRFWIFLDSLLRPTSPPSVIVRCRSTYLSHPLPTSSPSSVLRPPGSRPHLTPAIFRRSYPRPAPHPCACCRSRVRSPPCCCPRPAPSSLSSPGCSPVTGTSIPLWPCLPPPFFCASSVIFWFLVSFFIGCPFSTRARGQGASTPWRFLAPSLVPPANWPRRRCQATWLPPPPPCCLENKLSFYESYQQPFLAFNIIFIQYAVRTISFWDSSTFISSFPSWILM